MAPILLEHLNLVHHQAALLQQLRKFWKEDQLCDVVLKSSDGTEHHAHTNVLSAASTFFKNLLSGSFLEAERVQRGEPVEIAASKAAVSALLDFIYGGQPQVQLAVGLELLRLAEAFDLPKLAGAIEVGVRASMDSSAALQILQETHGLHILKAACEEKIAEDFETCSQHPEFGKLSASQLARILRREDLCVSREEAVLKGLLTWHNTSKDGSAFLGILLQNVDFQSISVENLHRLRRLAVSGQIGEDLHREVDEALRVKERKRPQSPHSPKRRCFQHWSPYLGASIEAPGRQVLPIACNSLCWHKDALYATDYQGSILCWKPGDPASTQQVAGGARVTGITELGSDCDLSISPTGEIFVADFHHNKLVSFQDGSRHVVLDLQEADTLCCSPNGVLYVVNDAALQKLVGSTLQTMIAFKSFDLEFSVVGISVIKDEVIYLSDNSTNRILRINPAESSPWNQSLLEKSQVNVKGNYGTCPQLRGKPSM
eukprot:s2576_g7.t2